MPIRTVTACRTPDDWKLAALLLGEYLDWLGPASGVGDVRSVQRSADLEITDLRVAFGRPDDRFFLGRLGSRAAGTVGVRRCGDDAELVRLYVHPAARGSGLGRLLVERAVEHAAAIRAGRLVLDTHDGVMPAAVALYRRLGFVEVDEPCPIPVSGAARFALPVAGTGVGSPV